MNCPSCESGRIRRGGIVIWSVYVALIALGIPAVMVFHFNAAVVAAIMAAVAVLTNLVVDSRICLDCGHQWRP